MQTPRENTQQRPLFALPFARRAKRQSIIPDLTQVWFFLPCGTRDYFVTGIVKGYDAALKEYHIIYLNPILIPDKYYDEDEAPADIMAYVGHEYRAIPAADVFPSYTAMCRACQRKPTFRQSIKAYMSFCDVAQWATPIDPIAYLRSMYRSIQPHHLGRCIYFVASEEE